MTKSVWHTLSTIDCSDHTESKNGMTYLSWAWAWMIVKQNYPQATFSKQSFTDSDGNTVPFMRDSHGYTYVEVMVSIEISDSQVVHATEIMPVLDHRNKAMQNPDGFAVNKAHQRCLVKCLAYLGLGVTIYAGEDLPLSDIEEEKDAASDAAQKIILQFDATSTVEEIDKAWRDNAGTIQALTSSARTKVTNGFKKKKQQIKSA